MRAEQVAPRELLATPEPDESVTLRWEQSGNARGVSFVVESQDASGEWRFAGTTTATRIRLGFHSPGVTVNFRVRASRGERLSLPSTIAKLCPTAIVAPLRLAA